MAAAPDPTGGYYGALTEDDPEELYETAPCGYVSVSPAGLITKANRTFLAWTGYDHDDVVNHRRFQTLLTIGDRIFWETHFAPSLRMQGSVREIAVEMVCASGERLPVLLNAVMKIDAKGEPIAARIAVFDARERRSYERELLAARRAAEEAAAEARALAETLQRTFLPPAPPVVPGLDVGGAYRPAGEGNVVGGDFWDMFDIGEGTWGVVLGDVCGKGAAAAVVTALARHTVRAEAMRTRSPAEVLGTLHDVIERGEEGNFCTALYGTVRSSADGARFTLAAGGHHLPLRVRADGSIEEVGKTGSLLGLLGPPRLHDTSVDLAPGDAIVLYTDGVVEARAGTEFLGEERLCELVVENRHLGAQELADAVASSAVDFQDGHTRDDIAVVVLAVPRA